MVPYITLLKVSLSLLSFPLFCVVSIDRGYRGGLSVVLHNMLCKIITFLSVSHTDKIFRKAGKGKHVSFKLF